MKPTPLSAARAAPVDWRALAAATAACALIAATSLIAKLLGGAGAGAEALHPLQISAGRFALGVAAAFALMRPGFQGTPWPTHGARALCGWLGVTCFFAASTRIPLADATAISFLSPLFAIGFAALMLRETVRRPQIAGALIATFGAALLLAPGGGGIEARRLHRAGGRGADGA